MDQEEVTETTPSDVEGSAPVSEGVEEAAPQQEEGTEEEHGQVQDEDQTPQEDQQEEKETQTEDKTEEEEPTHTEEEPDQIEEEQPAQSEEEEKEEQERTGEDEDEEVTAPPEETSEEQQEPAPEEPQGEEQEESVEELKEEEVAEEGADAPPPPPPSEDAAVADEGPESQGMANGTVDDDEMYSHMSTSVEVVNEDALRQAVADLRSDASGLNRKSWVVVGHVDNNPNLVDIVAKDVSEESSLADVQEVLQDDQVMYILVRLTATVDMSATVKFVYIHWVGDQVPFVKRGRYGVVHGCVEAYFNPYHVLVETGNPDELVEEELVKVLEQKSMTANRIVETPTDNRHQRGFTQHQVNRSGPTQQPKAVAPSAGNTVEVSPEINETIGAIRQDSSPVTWLLAGYEQNNVKNPLCLVAKGSGDIEELKEGLESDHVMYGLLRTSDVYDDITTVKFVYIYWVGEEVKPMMKGKVYANAGSVESIFSPMHVTLSVSNIDELTPEVISDKVASSSGSKSFVK